MLRTLTWLFALLVAGGYLFSRWGEYPAAWTPWIDHPWQSGVAGLATCLLTWSIVWIFDSVNYGQRNWQKRLRSSIGVEGDTPISEASWVKYLALLLLWGALPIVILRIWGLVAEAEALVLRLSNTGFKVGELTLVPGKIMFGILLFAALVTFTRWFKWKLESSWLRRTGIESSTRESVATIFGYTTFIIALLVGLSVAGVSFGNLAIVAGALSVGIGFGLQNIVNNFVSGLILLFERPIRTGDFITCNGRSGFVRKIRIRSTEVETLDRMSVVIPNSELIANAVDNWMLRDRYGRITVTVGVAYGTDTDLVRRTLISVAEKHPAVLHDVDEPVPGPQVLFDDFGDSALVFSLKVYVRDIDKRFLVASELRFAIDRAFREAGITIPFPQRDVWVKQPPGKSSAADIHDDADPLDDPEQPDPAGNQA